MKSVIKIIILLCSLLITSADAMLDDVSHEGIMFKWFRFYEFPTWTEYNKTEVPEPFLTLFATANECSEIIEQWQTRTRAVRFPDPSKHAECFIYPAYNCKGEGVPIPRDNRTLLNITSAASYRCTLTGQGKDFFGCQEGTDCWRTASQSVPAR